MHGKTLMRNLSSDYNDNVILNILICTVMQEFYIVKAINK